MVKDVNDEITLKELILTIQDYWKELWRNWWKIGLITIPFLAYFIYKTYSTPPTYKAEIKFFVEGDSGSSAGIGGLLGSFGIKTGGGKNNPYQILEVLESKNFLTQVLFTEGENKYLINDIIVNYKLDEKWSKHDESLLNFKFSNDSLKGFRDSERIALINIIKQTKNPSKINPLLVFSFDEDKGFYVINSSTNEENVSFNLVTNAYSLIKNYFEEKTLSGYTDTRNYFKNKVDSLDLLVKSKMYQAARFGDSNIGLNSLEKLTKRDILQRDITGLSLAQIEAVKAYEMADFNLKNKRNQFMVIDEPYLPLEKVEESLVSNILKGILLGLLIGIFLVLMITVLKKTINS